MDCPDRAAFPESSDMGNEEEAVEPQRDRMQRSLDVRTANAEWFFYRYLSPVSFISSKGTRCSFSKAYELAKSLKEECPQLQTIYPIYLATCLELNKKTEISLTCHSLNSIFPESALTFYAFGVYYMEINKPAEAKKFFNKAKLVDKYFVPAWIGLGNSFAAQARTDRVFQQRERF